MLPPLRSTQLRPSRNRNEYFENAELMAELESRCPRGAFSNALFAYAQTTDPNKRIRLIEAVIRSSRGVANDTTRLKQSDREIIGMISISYAAFVPKGQNTQVETYAEARELLRACFF